MKPSGQLKIELISHEQTPAAQRQPAKPTQGGMGGSASVEPKPYGTPLFISPAIPHMEKITQF